MANQPWCGKRTPFQIGLLLVLLIAGSFLIALLIYYLLFTTMWNRSIDCKRDVCMVQAPRMTTSNAADARVRHDGRSYDLDLDATYQDGVLRMRIAPPSYTPTIEPKKCSENISTPFPYVAALLDDLYEDEPGEEVLTCIVALLSQIEALTSSECINLNKLSRYRIRAASNYWSKDGFVMKIHSVEAPDNIQTSGYFPLILKLVGFPDKFCAPLVHLSPEGLSQIDQVFTFAWSSSFQLPLSQRSKFAAVQKVNMNLLPLAEPDSKRNGSLLIGGQRDQDYTSCGHSINAPLVNRLGEIVAFTASVYCDEDDREYSYYEDISRYVAWIKGAVSRLS